MFLCATYKPRKRPRPSDTSFYATAEPDSHAGAPANPASADAINDAFIKSEILQNGLQPRRAIPVSLGPTSSASFGSATPRDRYTPAASHGEKMRRVSAPVGSSNPNGHTSTVGTASEDLPSKRLCLHQDQQQSHSEASSLRGPNTVTHNMTDLRSDVGADAAAPPQTIENPHETAEIDSSRPQPAIQASTTPATDLPETNIQKVARTRTSLQQEVNHLKQQQEVLVGQEKDNFFGDTIAHIEARQARRVAVTEQERKVGDMWKELRSIEEVTPYGAF